MNIQADSFTTQTVLTRLRAGLEPVEHCEQLVDAIEGNLPQARRAAVLIPLFEQDGELCLAFILRASTLRAHSGEVAFPGGGREGEDASLVETALREAYEEIGLEPERVDVLGVLMPVFTVVSNYLITPIVAYLPLGLGELRLQSSEVAEVLIIPLRALADPAIGRTETWMRGEVARLVYFYDYGSHRIWGATGRMLNDLLALLTGEAEPQDQSSLNGD